MARRVGKFKIKPREAAVIGGAAVAADTVVGQFWPEYGGLISILARFFVGG